MEPSVNTADGADMAASSFTDSSGGGGWCHGVARSGVTCRGPGEGRGLGRAGLSCHKGTFGGQKPISSCS